MKTIYTIPAPDSLGAMIEVYGEPENAWYEWRIIDGGVVNGSWKLVGAVSGVVRWVQSGFIFHYALVMILGVFALMTWFVWGDFFMQLIK